MRPFMPSARRAWSRPIHCARVFEGLEKYTPFRPLISRRGFNATRILMRFMLVLAAVLAGAIMGWATPRLADDTAHSLALGGAAVFVADGYLIVLIWVRQTTGQQLQQVVDPPNGGLFRALDLPPLAIFAAYSAAPTALFYVAILAFNAVALGLLDSAGAGIGAAWWVLLVPIVGLLGTLSTTAALAVGRRPARHVHPREKAVVLVAVAIAGLVSGRLIGTVRAGDLASIDVTRLADPPEWLVALTLAVILVLGWHLLGRVQALRRHSFLLPVSAEVGTRPPRRWWSGLTASAYHRTAREFRAHPSAAMVGRSAGTIVAVMVLLLGLAIGGVGLEPAVIRQWVIPATTGYLFVSLLIMVGLAFSIVGPSSMIRQYRFEWENSGRTSTQIAWDAMIFHLIVVTPTAAMVALVQSVTSGTVSTKALALAWGLVGAATIGETLVPPRLRVDGSSTPGPLAPFVIVLLTAPVLGLGNGPWWSIVQCAYGVILLGVGIQCLSCRIQRLPLSSAVSPPATAAIAAPS